MGAAAVDVEGCAALGPKYFAARKTQSIGAMKVLFECKI